MVVVMTEHIYILAVTPPHQFDALLVLYVIPPLTEEFR